MDIKVSIIIPMYNSENYIDKCIQSVINQTLNNIEILLVDDGSKDKTLEICNKYSSVDRRIKIIKQENNGVSYARNIGLDFAIGEYITFVDSDDFIENDMLEILYYEAVKNNCDIIMSGFNIINGSGINYTMECDSKIYNKQEVFKLFYFDKKPFSPNYAWGKLIKRSIFNNIRFREDIFLMEDTLFSIQLFMKCSNNIMYINKYLYNYVQREGSESKRFSKKRITSFYALEELINIAKCINEEYERAFLKVYSVLILSILQDIIRYNYEEIKKEYFKISKSLNKRYLNNLINKEITNKNKIHLSIIKISPKLYRKVLMKLK